MAAQIRTTEQSMTGGWDAYVIPMVPRPYSVLVQSRTNVDLQLSHEVTGAAYFTIKRGAAFAFDTPNLGGVTVYLKGAVAQVVETVIQRAEP